MASTAPTSQQKPKSPATTTPKARRAGRVSVKSVTAGRVLRQFRELFRLSRQPHRRGGARGGLGGAQLWAMAELNARPGMKVSELASALSVHLSTASNLLDRLQAKSLVRRQRSDDDQRIVRVHLTRAGQRFLLKAPPPASEVIPEALQRLPAETLADLSRDLTMLLDLTRARDDSAGVKPLAEI